MDVFVTAGFLDGFEIGEVVGEGTSSENKSVGGRGRELTSEFKTESSGGVYRSR